MTQLILEMVLQTRLKQRMVVLTQRRPLMLSQGHHIVVHAYPDSTGLDYTVRCRYVSYVFLTKSINHAIPGLWKRMCSSTTIMKARV